MTRFDESDVSSDGGSRGLALLVTAAVTAVLALMGAVAFTTVVDDGGPADAGPDVGPATELAASALPAPAPAAPAQGVIETFEVFGGKNPFERPAELAPPPDVDLDGDGLPDDGFPTDPDDTIPPPTGGDTNGDGVIDGNDGLPVIDDPETTPARGRTVALQEIYAEAGLQVANVQVDGVVYTAVREGDTFADNFQLVSLDPAVGCGDFLLGDDDFTLCVGQALLK